MRAMRLGWGLCVSYLLVLKLTGASAIEGSRFVDSSRPANISAVNCSGIEASLSDCPYEIQACAGSDVAGVMCQGELFYCSVNTFTLSFIRPVYNGWQL